MVRASCSPLLAPPSQLTTSTHSLLNVHRHISARHARALSARGPTPALQEAYTQLMPIVAFTLLAAMWVLSPWGGLMREERMIEFGVLVCEFAFCCSFSAWVG